VNAIQAGDPDGTDVLLEREYAIRINAGTKVRVVQNPGQGALTVPTDERGTRIVRIIEGQWKGKVVSIPTRNLRPVPTQRKQKS
jgi:hypothetical protein